MAKWILVVDDSTIIRTQVREALEEAGFSVVEAENGNAALIQSKARTFDLIITDLHMPEMDGLTLVGHLRAADAYEDTPIFMLTTESDTDTVGRGRSAGVTAWVTKPVRSEVLLGGVRLVLAG